MRKTLSCERLEDCQRECADERRFICEGFNYRLDPTGRGQGNCELIEVPLSEMDLYSSPHSRDSNLLNHPDYDYFERDRNNSPSCRIPSPCTDCGSKPPSTSIDYYRPPPQSLPPSSGYGGSFVEPPPPAQNYGPYRPIMPVLSQSSASSGGYSSSSGWMQNRFDRYDNTAVDLYRPNANNYEYPSGPSYRPQAPPQPPPPPQVDRYDYAPRPGPMPSYGEDIRPDYRPQQETGDFYGGNYRPALNKPRPSYPSEDYNRIPRPGNGYSNTIDRGDQGYGSKPPSSSYIPYLIGQSYGSYGSSSNSEQYNKYSVDYWGLRGGGDDHRKEGNHFNYHELGSGNKYHNVPAENSNNNNNGWSYGSRYGQEGHVQDNSYNQNVNYSTQWTRRPGAEGKCGI